MRSVALLLALLMAFAGCTDKDAVQTPAPVDPGSDGGGGNGTNGTGSSGGGGNGTGGSNGDGNVSNTPPTVTLAANVTTNMAPFIVVFDINGTDADGDVLSWMLDADGDGVADLNGSALPANATFEYAAAGAYNVTVDVSDGANTIQVNITLVLSESGPPALPPWVGSGVADGPCPQCREVGANTGAGYRAGVSGLDSVFVALPAEYIGYPFVAKASAGDIDLSFRTACSAGGAVGDPFAKAGAESGVVPEGAACVLMWNYDTPDSTLTITVG